MASNYMCTNNSSTENLPVIPKTAATTALFDGSVIRVGDATITASIFVRNLGVVIDRQLDFKKQVSTIVSVCLFHLRHINNIQLLSWSEGDTRNCNTRGSVVARGRSPRATTLPRVLQSWCHPNGGTIIVLLYQTVIK